MSGVIPRVMVYRKNRTCGDTPYLDASAAIGAPVTVSFPGASLLLAVSVQKDWSQTSGRAVTPRSADHARNSVSNPVFLWNLCCTTAGFTSAASYKA